MSKQQKTILFTIIIFLLVGLVLAAYLARQIVKPTPRAAENKVTFTLEPSNPAPEPGEEITVALFASPPANGTKIRTLSAYIKYSGPIQITEVTKGNQSPFDQWDYLKVRDNPSKSRIEILAAYKPMEAEPDASGYLAGNQAAQFATIKLIWGNPELEQQTSGYLDFVTEPATTGAKDPKGGNISFITKDLTIPSAPAENPISWKTDHVSLQADNFYIIADGQKYYGNVEPVRLASDAESSTYTTLEVEWRENDREMRLYMYFKSEGEKWWSDEIRTYNGQSQADWIYYKGHFFETELGRGFTGNIDLTSDPDNKYKGSIHFENLRLQAFLSQAITPSATPPVSPDVAALYFEPDTIEAGIGEELNVTIKLNTGRRDISGVDAVVTFDQNILDYVKKDKTDIIPPKEDRVPGFAEDDRYVIDDKNADTGEITVSALIHPDPGNPDIDASTTKSDNRDNLIKVNGSEIPLGTLTFKVLSLTRTAETTQPLITKVSFDFTPGDPNDSNIVEFLRGEDILETIHDATITIPNKQLPGTSLKLKLDMCSRPNNRPVTLSISEGTYFHTQLIADGTTLPILLPASATSITVEVAGYLRHTFNIMDRNPGPDAGKTIDLSRDHTLVAGDVDASGMINATDYRDFIGTYNSRDLKDIASDLDCSGKVTAIDHDGMVRNWNKCTQDPGIVDQLNCR